MLSGYLTVYNSACLRAERLLGEAAVRGAGSGSGQAHARLVRPTLSPDGLWFVCGMHVGRVTWNNILYSLVKILHYRIFF